MTKPSELFPSSSSPSPSSKLGIVDKSQVIAKLKPKIRVIHVDAPKIIQTDAANFRDLVQRLTGKQEPRDNNIRRTMEKEGGGGGGDDFLGLRKRKRIKNELGDEEDDDEISRRSKSNNKEIRLSTGFFDHHHHGFSELDGFIEQLSTMN